MANFLKGFADKAVGSIKGQLGPLGDLFGTPSLRNALSGNVKTPSTASFNDSDWRVRLSLPDIDAFNNSPILAPLKETDGLVFPYTPSIIMNHSANYNALQPIHTNYPFFNYQNSSTENFTIVGDFFVENAVDAKYWIAVLHYLRSVTKMFYGAGQNLGAPPPIVKLNGYGDFVFNNVPVVVTTFNIDLPADVDYIKTGLNGSADSRDIMNVDVGDTLTEEEIFQAATGGTSRSTQTSANTGWVPAQSQFAVTVQPMYSRKKVSSFNLNSFIKGDLDGEGFI